MTATEKNTSPRQISPAFNRWFYGAFVMLSIYFLAFSHDWMTAASNLGIALIFDPFVKSGSWENRKSWQKAWLFIHVLLVAGLFITGFALK